MGALERIKLGRIYHSSCVGGSCMVVKVSEITHSNLQTARVVKVLDLEKQISHTLPYNEFAFLMRKDGASYPKKLVLRFKTRCLAKLGVLNEPQRNHIQWLS